MEHLKDFSHAAIVTDSGWIGPFTRLIAAFFSVQIRVFGVSEKEKARKWLAGAEVREVA